MEEKQREIVNVELHYEKLDSEFSFWQVLHKYAKHLRKEASQKKQLRRFAKWRKLGVMKDD